MITETVPLMVFVLVGLFSPGPNVVMLTVSGARFGFRATIPHLLGVPFGTGLLAASSAFGLNVLLLTHPALNLFFQILAAVWILFLAWQTAFAGRSTQAEDSGVPFTFFQAILFQAVNPKLWAITFAASSGFSIGLAPYYEALRLFIVFTCINLCVCLFWTKIGHLLSDYLSSEKVWRIFMTVMATFMASTVFLIFS